MAMSQADLLNKITSVLASQSRNVRCNRMTDMTQSLPSYIESMMRYVSVAQLSPSLQPPKEELLMDTEK